MTCSSIQHKALNQIPLNLQSITLPLSNKALQFLFRINTKNIIGKKIEVLIGRNKILEKQELSEILTIALLQHFFLQEKGQVLKIFSRKI